ncbi:hypothetical protein C8R43DRAFT_954469 [Mycena crocata]|nr:hypothetical protein C8R43DRAFT_954469 [Mycena crocata]
MIPIGHIDHRDRVRATRFINGLNGTTIPDHIRIAKEGEPIRTLGAWVGNGIVQVDTWTRTHEKIDEALERWELGHPTMEGRQLIVLMVVGGMTQYLATVQGMPKTVEKKLEKRIRNFLWAEKTNVTVNQETIYAPAEMGGKNLLDIVARNEAITITWLKTYLSFGPNRPLWCFVSDDILAHKISGKDSKRVKEGMRLNAYLQSWSPKTSAKSVGKDLSGMIKIGKTYGVDMDVMEVSRDIQGDMPVWYHRKSLAGRSLYNNGVEVVTCLQENHKISVVRDAAALGRKRDAPGHRPLKRCRCDTCRQTRIETGCQNPHQCYSRARSLLDALHAKWDPLKPQPEDYEEEQTPREGLGPETVDFDSRITTRGSVADTFRIFTKGSRRNLRGIVPQTKHDPVHDYGTLVAYTDGSAVNNGKENARVGAGVYFGEGDPRNTSIGVPNKVGRSNNTGEMAAINIAVETCPTCIPLEIRSDSRVSIGGLTRNLQKAEDSGFYTVENSELTQKTLSNLRQREATTSFTWVKAHNGEEGNEAADALAAEGSAATTPDAMDMTVNPIYILPGAKLQAMTQSSAYKIIRKIKMSRKTYQAKLARKATLKNMELAQAAAENEDGETPAPSTIWKSTKNKDISRNIRFFLWMLIHDGYKVGQHWEKIPGHEEKATCKVCDCPETMQHILTKCEAPGQVRIWKKASELWKLKTGEDLPKPVMGQIMTCAAIKKLMQARRAYSGLSYRSRPTSSGASDVNEWLKGINNRLRIDCELTNVIKYGKRSLKKEIVLKTWCKALKKESELPQDWTRETGVLVPGVEKAEAPHAVSRTSGTSALTHFLGWLLKHCLAGFKIQASNDGGSGNGFICPEDAWTRAACEPSRRR